jgi:hypothetical protein
VAVPTLTGLTEIFDFDADTGTPWGTDTAKWEASPDIKIEGTNSMGLPPKTSTGDGGYGYHYGSNIDLSSNLLAIWVYTAEGYCNTFDNYGVYIRITSDTSGWTNYSDYKVGGSDVAWTGKGWHLVVLDANRTRDRGNGTVTLSTIRGVGAGFVWLNTSSKAVTLCVDIAYYGTGVEMTGVTSSSASHSFTTGTNTITRASGDFSSDGFEVGDLIEISGTVSNDGYYTLATVGTTTMTTSEALVTESTVTSNIDGFVTLEDIYQKDGPTDGLWYGVVTKNTTGSYSINMPLTVGDVSGSNRAAFVSRGDVVFLADQPLSTTREDYLITAIDSGTTKFMIGDSVGTGDDRVGFNGSFIKGEESVFSTATPKGLDLDAVITALELYGATFQDVDAGIELGAATTKRVTNVSFTACGQIDLSSAESRNLIFSSYDGTDGALLWSASIDIKNSTFLACTNATGDAAAIEHPTAGSFSYVGLAFAGNDYDVRNSANATTVDSYAPTEDGDVDVYNGSITRVAQQFTGTAGTLTGALFSIRYQGSPTGNVYARLYANSGGAPTGTALAESNAIDITDLTTSFADVQFEFEDEYTLVAATEYHIAIEYTGGDSSNRLEVEYLTAGDGSETCNTYISSWGSQTYDCRFQVSRDGLVDISYDGDSSPATDDNSGSPEGATILTSSVIITITVQDEATDPISAVQTAVYKISDRTELMNEDTTALGVATQAYTGATPVDVEIRCRKASGGATKYYNFSTLGQISGDFDLLVTMIEDPYNASTA